MILVDTSGLLAALDAAQRLHREAAASLAAASPPLLLSPFVLAELDDLLATRSAKVASPLSNSGIRSVGADDSAVAAIRAWRTTSASLVPCAAAVRSSASLSSSGR